MKINSLLWIFLVALVLTIYFFNRLLAIWLTILFLSLALISYAFSLSFKKKLLRAIQKYNRKTDIDIANELDFPIKKVRENLSKLYKHQKRKGSIIVYLSDKYIFYNEETINEFKQLYSNGINEKEIFENLKISIGLKTRAEVKAIKDILYDYKKLETEETETRIKDQIRKSEIY